MGTRACYLVQEKTEAGNITSTYKTTDYFMAVADMLLKSKSPLNIEIRKKLAIDSTLSAISDCRLIADFYEYIYMQISIIDKKTLQRKLIIMIDTIIIASDDELGFSASSSRAYLDESYHHAIKAIAKRLREWSKDDFDIARVLSVCASRDPSHIFWRQRRPPSKQLGM